MDEKRIGELWNLFDGIDPGNPARSALYEALCEIGQLQRAQKAWVARKFEMRETIDRLDYELSREKMEHAQTRRALRESVLKHGG